MVPQLAVATITWVRSAAEGKALARSLARLADAGLPIAVADRGTASDFPKSLRKLGVRLTVASDQGLVPQVQASVELAATFGTPFILYVEPDKEDFFTSRLGAFIERMPNDDDLGVVLASRSAAAYQTFPPMQRYTEGVVNRLCGEVIGIPGDYSYGPFMMNRTLLRHIAALDPSLGWGWRTSTFVAAHRQRLKVLHLVDEHACPVDQREERDADRAHRLRQLSQNILGLVQ